MTVKQQLLQILPPEVQQQLQPLSDQDFAVVQEIRLRSGKPLMLHMAKGAHAFPHTVTQQQVELCVQLMSGSSVYALLDEITNGFITLTGGHRVGLCGRVILEKGGIRNLRNISGINIRVARQVLGCGNGIMPHIGLEHPKNTLLISPPQCGKTTILRDIARQLGAKHKVSIIDERGEISAMQHGVPQYDVGAMTDTLDLCPKELGIPMMLRSMSPDILLTDEIAQKDIPTLQQAFSYGVGVIASAHGDSVAQTMDRLHLSDIASHFDVIVVLSRRNGVGTIEHIYEGDDVPCC